jgi:aspartate carbamoyltransferase catalytic subunit
VGRLFFARTFLTFLPQQFFSTRYRTVVNFRHPHLLSVRQLHADDIQIILDKARGYRAFISTAATSNDLAGLVVLNAFFEPSTRTRSSFEIAAKKLGAHVVNFHSQSSSISKGESLKDTLATLDAMGLSIVVMRHRASGAAEYAASIVKAGIINAGDGMHEHPTQALLDVLTLQDVVPQNSLRAVGIVGDLLHSRVFRSNVHLLNALGIQVHVLAPPTLMPRDMSSFPVTIHSGLDDLLATVDAVMMLRLQNERMSGGLLPRGGEYRKYYGLTMDHMHRHSHLHVLHPGPANYGWELDENVTDHSRCHMRAQVTNGVFIRMACMSLVAGRS